eukprot:TRINITY_DN11324_c0_g1_i2.p1 TRINITY_DN11324_c0_g1~~TRINITY_DN11324_c0_g1_i2.p1  ORF type:complete len:629 (-),score=78.37 TRINITY_DN11324_c0_g1_i2:138-1961(-)
MPQTAELELLLLLVVVLSISVGVSLSPTTICHGKDCDRQSFACPPGDTCSYDCEGEWSCWFTDFYCEDSLCKLSCNGDYSCIGINVTTTGTTLPIYGRDNGSEHTEVICNGYGSCSQMRNSYGILRKIGQHTGIFAVTDGFEDCSNCPDRDNIFVTLNFTLQGEFTLVTLLTALRSQDVPALNAFLSLQGEFHILLEEKYTSALALADAAQFALTTRENAPPTPELTISYEHTLDNGLTVVIFRAPEDARLEYMFQYISAVLTSEDTAGLNMTIDSLKIDPVSNRLVANGTISQEMYDQLGAFGGSAVVEQFMSEFLLGYLGIIIRESKTCFYRENGDPNFNLSVDERDINLWIGVNDFENCRDPIPFTEFCCLFRAGEYSYYSSSSSSRNDDLFITQDNINLLSNFTTNHRLTTLSTNVTILGGIGTTDGGSLDFENTTLNTNGFVSVGTDVTFGSLTQFTSTNGFSFDGTMYVAADSSIDISGGSSEVSGEIIITGFHNRSTTGDILVMSYFGDDFEFNARLSSEDGDCLTHRVERLESGLQQVFAIGCTENSSEFLVAVPVVIVVCLIVFGIVLVVFFVPAVKNRVMPFIQKRKTAFQLEEESG